MKKVDVVLFGASSLGEIAYNFLKDQFNIVAFCDNDQEKIGKEKLGKKIIGVNEIRELGNIHVIITSLYFKEIVKQLIENDINSFELFRYNKHWNEWKLAKWGLSSDIGHSLLYISSLVGFSTNMERNFLIYLPSLVSHIEGDIAEIGSYHGKSAICLGLGNILFNNRRKKIYCIDPFKSYTNARYNDGYFDEFNANITYAGLADDIVPVKKNSVDASIDVPKLSAIFIDGDHSYEAVVKDIQNYAPKISKGGLMAFHDYGRFGVAEAVDELNDNADFQFFCDCHSIKVYKKVR